MSENITYPAHSVNPNPYIPNATTLPNILFDYWMNVLSPAEFKVLMCIARKTYGWGKTRDLISLSQIERMTGLSRRSVVSNIQALINHGVITKTESLTSDGDTAPNLYEININCPNKGGSELSSPPYAKNAGGSELSSLGSELSAHTNNSLPIKESNDICSINTHTPPTPNPTSSGVCVENSSECKKPKPQKDRMAKISDRAKSFFSRFVDEIKAYKKNYVVKNEINMLESIQEMLDDGRLEDEILEVLRWGLNDNEIRGDWNGWSSKILCKNPAAYLANKFDQIENASKSRPKTKCFNISSDNKKARAIAEEMMKNAL